MLPITTARLGSMALAVLILAPSVLIPEPAAAQWRNLSRESPEEDVKQFMRQINATRVTIREGEHVGDTIRISARAAGWISVKELADRASLSFQEEEGYMAPLPHVVMTYVNKGEGVLGDTDVKIVAAPRDPDHEVALFTQRPGSKYFGVGEARPGTRTQMWGEELSLTLRVYKQESPYAGSTRIFVGTQEPVDENDPPVWVDLLIIELEGE